MLVRGRRKEERLLRRCYVKNAACRNAVRTAQASTCARSKPLSRLFGGRLTVCERSNLKRIEHHTRGHGGSGFGAMVREVVSC